MGNCAPKQKRSPAAAKSKTAAIVRLYGSESCPISCRIRFSLLCKPSVVVQFVPSEGPTLVTCGPDTVSGSAESLLRYLDGRLGGPAAAVAGRSDAAAVAEATALQHRSMASHAARLARRAADLVAGGGVEERAAEAEAKRMGRWYGQLVDVMLEHARMEERLLFPALELDSHLGGGVCHVAKEEHGRDLPLMNGIKEDIKSLVAMEATTSIYDEALLNLSTRFKTLQSRCEEHFEAEERDLLPLLEGAERMSSERWVERVMEAMDETHSHLFPFFMSGLLPDEALRYVDLVCSATTAAMATAALKGLRPLVAPLLAVVVAPPAPAPAIRAPPPTTPPRYPRTPPPDPPPAPRDPPLVPPPPPRNPPPPR